MVMEFSGCVGGIGGIGAGAGICCPYTLATAQKARQTPARDKTDLEGLMEQG